VTIADKKMRVTQVALKPRITIAPGGDEAKARSLVEARTTPASCQLRELRRPPPRPRSWWARLMPRTPTLRTSRARIRSNQPIVQEGPRLC
jgi:hypothetical protein